MILALVIGSAVLHALWNALLKLEADKDHSLVAAIGVASLFAMVVAGLRWAFGGAMPFTSVAGVGFTALAGIAEAAYFTTLARALTVGRLGTVYTVSRGGAVLVVFPLSIALFGEHLTHLAAAGSATVLAGLVVCGLGARGAAGARNPRAGLAWALVCAVSIAIYHLAYKGALLHGTSPSASFALSLALSWTISAGRLGRSGMAAVRTIVVTRWPRVVLMGIVCGGSFLILMEALARGGSGYVLTLRNTSVLFAALMAFAIGDRPARSEIGGALLVALGAVLMA